MCINADPCLGAPLHPRGACTHIVQVESLAQQLSALDAQLPDLLAARLPNLVAAQVPALITAKLPDLVAAQVPALITAKLPDLVAAQVPALITAKLPDLVAAQVPALITAKLPDLVAAQVPALVVAQVGPVASKLNSAAQRTLEVVRKSAQTVCEEVRNCVHAAARTFGASVPPPLFRHKGC